MRACHAIILMALAIMGSCTDEPKSGVMESPERIDSFLKTRPFEMVNEKLENQNKLGSKWCIRFMDSIQPEKVEMAKEFHLRSDSLYNVIENLKHEIINKLVSEDTTFVKQNIKLPKTYKGIELSELKKQLKEHRAYSERAIRELGLSNVKNDLNVDDVEEDGRKISWEKYYFEGMPTAGVITNLSKTQADIKNLECDVLVKLKK